MPERTTDDIRPDRPDENTPDEGNLMVNIFGPHVTVDTYTAFQCYVITLLKSIDGRLKGIQDALNQQQ